MTNHNNIHEVIGNIELEFQDVTISEFNLQILTAGVLDIILVVVISNFLSSNHGADINKWN